MKGLKREREEIDKKIETLAKQRRDQLIGDNATKFVIVKGDKRMIVPRSQLTQLIKEEKTNDITIIINPKSLHESDLADESHEVSCSKCGKQGIQLWRKAYCYERYNNPNILCISCLGAHIPYEWYQIRSFDDSIWYAAILDDEFATVFEQVQTFMHNMKVKEKFLALPKK
jgi:hypothetical protein